MTMGWIKFPLIVEDHIWHDVLIISAFDDQAMPLDPDSVSDSTCRVFDADGRRVSLKVVPKQTPVMAGIARTSIEQVMIEGTEEVPSHRDELREVLVNYLSRYEHAEGLKSWSLERLIHRAADVPRHRKSL